MNLNEIHRVYLIGIGGIGMSALARFFIFHNKIVSGYDKTETVLTKELQKLGIEIHFEDNLKFADKNADLIIYTPAIPTEHTELKYFLEHHKQVLKRSEILGKLTENKFTIAVAGSHGKTTVSSMISWILKQTGYDCTAFLGGISTNFNSNFVAGENDIYVVEADEYDRSFLRLNPNIAVITATDSDHLEIYGSQFEIEKAFAEFANKLSTEEILIAKSSLPILHQVKSKIWKYSLSDTTADLFCKAYHLHLGYSEVELSNGMHYQMKYPGIHNIENSIAAASVCLQLKIEPEKIAHALSLFTGIHRRFETIYQHKQKIVFIDDYAHHPEEIKMFLKSVKEIYPNKKITAIFQPHLFSRTKDLQQGFAESLQIADEIILLPIYPARESPMLGVTSMLILDRIKSKQKYLMDKHEVYKFIREHDVEIVCTIGAGDIDRMVLPISEILKTKEV